MLKLFKYEMIQSWRNFMFVFAGYLLLCLLVPVSDSVKLNENISAILVALLVFMVLGISIGVFITIARNFTNSMFNRAGYLTLTLPVSTHELLVAKLLSSLVWVLVSGVVLFVGLLIMMFTISGWDEVIRIVPQMFQMLGQIITEMGWELLQMLLSLVLNILLFTSLIFCALTVSHSSYIRNHRLFWTLVILVVYITVISVISNSIPANLNLANTTFISYTKDVVDSVNSSYWIGLGWNLIQFIALYFTTWFFLEKKVEVQ